MPSNPESPPNIRELGRQEPTHATPDSGDEDRFLFERCQADDCVATILSKSGQPYCARHRNIIAATHKKKSNTTEASITPRHVMLSEDSRADGLFSSRPTGGAVMGFERSSIASASKSSKRSLSSKGVAVKTVASSPKSKKKLARRSESSTCASTGRPITTSQSRSRPISPGSQDASSWSGLGQISKSPATASREPGRSQPRLETETRKRPHGGEGQHLSERANKRLHVDEENFVLSPKKNFLKDPSPRIAGISTGIQSLVGSGSAQNEQTPVNHAYNGETDQSYSKSVGAAGPSLCQGDMVSEITNYFRDPFSAIRVHQTRNFQHKASDHPTDVSKLPKRPVQRHADEAPTINHSLPMVFDTTSMADSSSKESPLKKRSQARIVVHDSDDFDSRLYSDINKDHKTRPAVNYAELNYAYIDPRVHYTQAYSEDWHGKKQVEISARGSRKQNMRNHFQKFFQRRDQTSDRVQDEIRSQAPSRVTDQDANIDEDRGLGPGENTTDSSYRAIAERYKNDPIAYSRAMAVLGTHCQGHPDQVMKILEAQAEMDEMAESWWRSQEKGKGVE